MDAKEYLGSFRPTPEPDELNNSDLVDHELEEILGQLYSTGDVYFLGDLPSPQVVEYAREFKSGSDFLNRLLKENAGHIAQLPANGQQGKVGMFTVPPVTPPETRVEWAMEADNEASIITNTGIQVTTSMLSNAIHKVSTRAPINEKQKQKAISWAVKGAIGDGRREVLSMLRPSLGSIVLRHWYYGQAETDFEVSLNRPVQFPTPRWLKETTEKDHVVHRLCASLGEVDAFVALLEWVQLRDIPYLPVFTPRAMESGQQLSGNGNLHSDLLLCSLGSRDIVPIQSKVVSTTSNTQKYDLENIVIVSARELGTEEVKPAIVEYNGNKKSGRVVEAAYGKLYTDWYNAYNSGNSRLKKQLHKDMGQAFTYFDKAIAPRLK